MRALACVDPEPPRQMTSSVGNVDEQEDIMMTDDLKREPDGIPHAVIGFTALFCVMFAMLLVAILLTGTTSGSVGAVFVGFVGGPVVASGLQRKAMRGRDHEHPSTLGWSRRMQNQLRRIGGRLTN